MRAHENPALTRVGRGSVPRDAVSQSHPHPTRGSPWVSKAVAAAVGIRRWSACVALRGPSLRCFGAPGGMLLAGL